ncbi:hypothetical protein L6164_029866 [Bauhinia variegata]|uniref:Uncharacterized protein n=1 Tax=Bauhinia variegata TaxID=167791 RepID=A0ACB9LAM2_BAUVA|nr:hypothetical protein L6164_029866 [Bauhinia variegata]
MDENSVRKPNGATKRTKEKERGEESDEDCAGDEECDAEVWDMLSRSFHQAQSVLDQNQALIQQVNDNHQSKIPDNLVQNVSLIREINGNISKVLSMYSDLSINFSNIVQQRRRGVTAMASKNGDDKVERKGDSIEHDQEKSQMVERMRDCIQTLPACRYELQLVLSHLMS